MTAWTALVISILALAIAVLAAIPMTALWIGTSQSMAKRRREDDGVSS